MRRTRAMSNLIPPVPDLDPHGLRLPIKLDSTIERRVRAHSARRFAAPRQSARARVGRRAGAQAGRNRVARFSPRCAAPPRRSSPSMPRMHAPAAGADSSRSPNDAELDPQLAAAELGKREFIFDVQGHFVNPTGAWTKRLPPGAKPLRDAQARSAICRRIPANAATCNCIGPRRVHQGCVPRLRHGSHGAELRAVHARG